MSRNTLTLEESNVLNLIQDNDDKDFYARKMLNGFAPSLKPAVEVIKVTQTEPVHQWTQRISFNVSVQGVGRES